MFRFYARDWGPIFIWRFTQKRLTGSAATKDLSITFRKGRHISSCFGWQSSQNQSQAKHLTVRHEPSPQLRTGSMPYLDRTRNTAKREGAQRWAKAHLTPFPQTKGGNGKAMPFPQSIGNGTVPAVPPALPNRERQPRRETSAIAVHLSGIGPFAVAAIVGVPILVRMGSFLRS